MSKCRKDVTAVAIVLYNCDPTQSSTLRSLDAAQAIHARPLDVVVIDNSPRVGYDRIALALQFSSLSITWIHNPNNPGLAFAYNQAAKIASTRGAEWLIVLDQDTYVHSSYLNAIQVQATPSVDMLIPQVISRGVVVSPFPTLLGRRLNHAIPVNTPISHRPFFAINSGMAVRVGWLKEIGGYDRRFWIYGVDSWICRALEKTGGKVVVLDTSIEHDLSEQVLNSNDAYVLRHAQYLEASRLLYAGALVDNAIDICLQFAGAVMKSLKRRDSRFVRNVVSRRIFH